MKSLKYLALCLVAALVTTSCSNDENEPQVSLKEGKPVKFEMSIAKTNTRTVTTGSGNNRVVDWRVGDAVGIFVYNETTPLGSGNYKYVFDGTDWVAASTSDAINLQDGENYSFYAYYPYSATGIASATNATLSVQTDQTTKDETTQNTGYDLSDILTAQTPNVSNGGTVALQFKHAFSMVEVLVAGDLVPSAPGSVILKSVATSAGINLTTGIVGATSANADVTMCLIESDPTKTTYLYRAIVPAQTVLANNTLLEVHGVGENGNKNYEFAHTEAVPYEQGKYRRIEVQIGKVEAGIKIPGGAIDEWTPSGGIDVPGKEMVVNLIKVPISLLDNNSFLQLSATNYDQAENTWYALTHKDDISKSPEMTLIDDAIYTKAISYKFDDASSSSWYKSGIGYHHANSFEPGYYKLSFQRKVTKLANEQSSMELYVYIRTAPISGNAAKDLYFISSKHDSQRYQMKASEVDTEWKLETAYFDFSYVSISAYNANDPLDLTIQADDNKYKLFDLKFTYLNNKSGTVQIADVKLEKVNLEDLPENQKPPI